MNKTLIVYSTGAVGALAGAFWLGRFFPFEKSLPFSRIQISASTPTARAGAGNRSHGARELGSAEQSVRAGHDDPQTALAWLASTPDAGLRSQALNSLVNRWGASDPKAAIGFVEKLPPGSTRANLLRSLVNNWACKDPKAALAYAEQLAGGAIKNELLADVVAQWAQSDPQGALAAAQKIPPRHRPHQRAARPHR